MADAVVQKLIVDVDEKGSQRTRDRIKRDLEDVGKVAREIGGIMSRAFDIVGKGLDLAKFATEMRGLERALPVGAMDRLRSVTRGTVSDMDLMRLGAKTMTGEFALTREQLVMVTLASETFAKRGLGSVAEISEKIHDALAKNVGKLDDLGINLKSTGVRSVDTALAFEKLRDVARTTAENIDATDDAVKRSGVTIENWTLTIKRAVGDMVTFILKGIEDLASKAGKVQAKGGTVATLGYVGSLFGGTGLANVYDVTLAHDDAEEEAARAAYDKVAPSVTHRRGGRPAVEDIGGLGFGGSMAALRDLPKAFKRTGASTREAALHLAAVADAMQANARDLGEWMGGAGIAGGGRMPGELVSGAGMSALGGGFDGAGVSGVTSAMGGIGGSFLGGGVGGGGGGMTPDEGPRSIFTLAEVGAMGQGAMLAGFDALISGSKGAAAAVRDYAAAALKAKAMTSLVDAGEYTYKAIAAATSPMTAHLVPIYTAAAVKAAAVAALAGGGAALLGSSGGGGGAGPRTSPGGGFSSSSSSSGPSTVIVQVQGDVFGEDASTRMATKVAAAIERARQGGALRAESAVSM